MDIAFCPRSRPCEELTVSSLFTYLNGDVIAVQCFRGCGFGAGRWPLPISLLLVLFLSEAPVIAYLKRA